jgi:hypothetical protein
VDPSFLESLPEAHPVDTEVVLREFFAATAKAKTFVDFVVAAGIASNQGWRGLQALRRRGKTRWRAGWKSERSSSGFAREPRQLHGG